MEERWREQVNKGRAKTFEELRSLPSSERSYLGGMPAKFKTLQKQRSLAKERNKTGRQVLDRREEDGTERPLSTRVNGTSTAER